MSHGRRDTLPPGADRPPRQHLAQPPGLSHRNVALNNCMPANKLLPANYLQFSAITPLLRRAGTAVVLAWLSRTMSYPSLLAVEQQATIHVGS